VSKTIEVPESLTREQYLHLIRSVGFAPEALISLEFRADGVYAETFDLDESGRKRIDRTKGEVVKNTTFVPVVDAEVAQ